MIFAHRLRCLLASELASARPSPYPRRKWPASRRPTPSRPLASSSLKPLLLLRRRKSPRASVGRILHAVSVAERLVDSGGPVDGGAAPGPGERHGEAAAGAGERRRKIRVAPGDVPGPADVERQRRARCEG